MTTKRMDPLLDAVEGETLTFEVDIDVSGKKPLISTWVSTEQVLN